LLQFPPMAVVDGILEIYNAQYEVVKLRTYHPLQRFPDYNWVKRR